ncbi:hypothetical protein C8Q74DRAFT_1370886 [Fomes fomentarius]|nr:hypothetical protein C8Q74DRAFT_1370886 [Fomes fomentarius]
MLGLLLVSLFSLARVVFASIYGVYPIANTVLSAGRLNTVRWIDDGTRPSIRNMGKVTIDLYVGESYIATLADLVDPRDLSTDVWISPSWRHNGSDYHMRFVCQHPPVTIYTADFTITGMTSLFPLHGPIIDPHNDSAASVVYFTPQLTLVLPDTTTVSNLKPVPSTTRASPTPSSSTTLQDEGSGLSGPRNGALTAGVRKRPTVDLERLKFRFVFVFWPTLIGITMAL